MAARSLTDSARQAKVPSVQELVRGRRRRMLDRGGIVVLVGIALITLVVWLRGGFLDHVAKENVSPATTVPMEDGKVLFGPPRIDRGETVEFPVTLLDGTELSVTLPKSIATDVTGFFPGGAAGWDPDICCSRTLDVVYGTIQNLYRDRMPDAEYEDAGGHLVGYYTDSDGLDYLVFQYGSWVVQAWDGGPTPGERFTPDNRTKFASLMNGQENPDGFLILTPADPMKLMATKGLGDATFVDDTGSGLVGVIRRDCTEPAFDYPSAVTSQGYPVSVSPEAGQTSLCIRSRRIVVWVSRPNLTQQELDAIDVTQTRR